MQLKSWRPPLWLAVGWLLIISILCFLPGSALPKEDWLNSISFDKWVHFGLFAVLLFLWRFQAPAELKYNYWFFAAAVFYGFGVETVQHFFIPNRSFDLWDVVADLAGSIAGLWLWWRVYKKNRPL